MAERGPGRRRPGRVRPGPARDRADRQLQAWEGGPAPAVPEWTRGVKTVDELLERLRDRASETPAGEWIRGGLTRMDFPNQKIPDRWDLDEAGPDHPVLLTGGCGSPGARTRRRTVP